MTPFGGFLFEVIASFIFILVIMIVTSATKGNGKIAGLVIGLSLTLIILVGLNITGLSVNPARSLAPALFVGSAALQQIWIFILAPIVGGVLAAIVAKKSLGYRREKNWSQRDQFFIVQGSSWLEKIHERAVFLVCFKFGEVFDSAIAFVGSYRFGKSYSGKASKNCLQSSHSRT